MLENPYFHAWVANTLDALGGFGAAYLQDVQREQALTFAELRMDARQLPFVGKFGWISDFEDSPLRPIRFVSAHSHRLH